MPSNAQIDRLVESVRAREKGARFGYGLTTADEYLKSVLDCEGSPEAMAKLCGGSMFDVQNALKEASQKLVFCGEGMGVEKSERATSVGKFRDMLSKGSKAEIPKHTLMLERSIVTTPSEDRDLDILKTAGARVDEKMPSLWQHNHMFPVGTYVETYKHTKDILITVSALLDLNDLTEDCAKLIEAGALRISHGFRAIDWKERKDGDGFEITEFEIMEKSFVSVPSNRDAEIELFSRKSLKSDLAKAHARKLWEARPAQSTGFEIKSSDGVVDLNVTVNVNDGKSIEDLPELEVKPEEEKGFDPTLEVLEASKLEYEWASRFLGCELKDLHVIRDGAGGLRMGSYLTGLDVVMSDYKVHDVRRITYAGKEVPPNHEVVQLDSETQADFLVDGMRFYVGEKRVIIKYDRGYGGIDVTLYAKSEDRKHANEILTKANAWATENNFLKGEAFSLTGGFIKKSDEAWDNVFLAKENKEAAFNAVKNLVENGRDAEKRGILMMGPPGTGKTLTGRIVRNEVAKQATFIWVSSRDFYYTGAMGGIKSAFDMARELSPAVLFIEDVDNWLSERTVDMLKTEMDGINQDKGLVTILTTNYPERLPKSLTDRPGRFHDVCKFDLPSPKAREAMLRAWLPGVETESEGHAKAIEKAVSETEGHSGAHIYHLCGYVKSISTEKSVGWDVALPEALEKLAKQRALIDEEQTAGSRYKPGKSTEVWTKSAGEFRVEQKGDDVRLIEVEKSGRALSKANLSKLEDAKGDLAEIKATEGLPRSAGALCDRALKNIDAVIATASVDEEEAKAPTLQEAQSVLFAVQELETVKATLDILNAVRKQLEDKKAAALLNI